MRYLKNSEADENAAAVDHGKRKSLYHRHCNGRDGSMFGIESMNPEEIMSKILRHTRVSFSRVLRDF